LLKKSIHSEIAALSGESRNDSTIDMYGRKAVHINNLCFQQPAKCPFAPVTAIIVSFSREFAFLCFQVLPG
jgi:hypothetical protein